MVLAKQSPYREFLDYQILKMMEVGVMKRLSNSDYLNENCNKNLIKWKAPNLKKTCSLFLLLFVGYGLSLLCFIIELIKPKWLDQFQKQSKVIPKSELDKELRKIVNTLNILQIAMENYDMDSIKVKQSVNLLEGLKNQ